MVELAHLLVVAVVTYLQQLLLVVVVVEQYLSEGVPKWLSAQLLEALWLLVLMLLAQLDHLRNKRSHLIYLQLFSSIYHFFLFDL